MSALAVVCAGLAAWWALGPRRVLPGPVAAPSRARWERWWLPGLAVLGLVLVWTVGGPRFGVPLAAMVAVVLTIARVLVLRERRRRGRRAAVEVARACTVLAAELELGRVPATALTAAAEDCPVLVPAAAAVRIGGDAVQTWRRQGTEPGHAGLLVLARAWQVVTVTGAPLAPALATVAAALGSDEEVDRMVAGELAAPRLTGVLLGVLPLAGLGLGYAIGGDPVGFLLGTPVGWVCLVGGSALACAGVLWTEHLAGQAERRSP